MNYRKFLAGIAFRATHPQFEPGNEHTGFVTGSDDGTPLIRVGDTILRLEGAAVPVDAGCCWFAARSKTSSVVHDGPTIEHRFRICP